MNSDQPAGAQTPQRLRILEDGHHHLVNEISDLVVAMREVRECLATGQNRMTGLEVELKTNSATTAEVRDILATARGAFRFFGILSAAQGNDVKERIAQLLALMDAGVVRADFGPGARCELEAKALALRESVIEMLIEAGSGHTAGPLGMADVFATLYFNTLKHDPKNPAWPERDRLVLSNGHICPVLYATMAHAGYFPVEELKTLRHFGSRLQGHPHREYLPYVDTSSGPLGSGISQAVGMALMDRLEEIGRAHV